MATILMMSTKMATLTLIKIKVFWIKCYDVIVSLHEVTNKTFLRDSNYIVDVVMCQNFGNSCISMREIVITSILYWFDQKKQYFRGVLLIQV